jgi:glyoxylase-like metal-dependent hydrolase (beta-lactamase superfamily II)
MKSTQLTDNLTKATKFGLMNAYFVLEEDGLTLVDTTMSAADALLAAAAQIGAPIRRIALTHAHSDHVGSVDALREKLGAEVPVLMPEIDARISRGEEINHPGKKRGGWPQLKTTPDVLLNPGDRVGSLEVVASPGHTPGHVAFLDTRDRSLIAGDAFSAVGKLEVPNHLSLRFPLPYGATWNRPEALESAIALRALEPTLLVLGHGHAVKNAPAEMDQAITRAKRAA